MYTCINNAGLRVTVICTCCPNSHLKETLTYAHCFTYIMLKSTIKCRNSTYSCTVKELKQNMMYGNTMQGWWHCLSHDLKPDLDMNHNRISHDISHSIIHATGKVKEGWPSLVGKGRKRRNYREVCIHAECPASSRTIMPAISFGSSKILARARHIRPCKDLSTILHILQCQ